MHLEAGSFLRDYEIEKLLGKGGMGTVYLAKDSFLDRYVAIKELNPILTADSELIARFRNEAKLQAKLIHTNIAVLYGFFEQNGCYYMVMEYAEGRTLKEMIRQTGPIPEERATNILKQVVSALEYAHGMGIIHRDIKPSNIILDDNDKVKILDFGIARIIGEKGLTQTGQQLGTLAYMSPEQVQAEQNIDGKTDIYSLGVTFFEMLSGRMPYDMNTESDFDVMTKIMNDVLPDPRSYHPHISDESIQILTRMTQKDREKRVDIAELIAHFDNNVNSVVFKKKKEEGGGFMGANSEERNDLPPDDLLKKEKKVKNKKKLWLIFLMQIVIVVVMTYIPSLSKKAERDRVYDEIAERMIRETVLKGFEKDNEEIESAENVTHESASQEIGRVSTATTSNPSLSDEETQPHFVPFDEEPVPLHRIMPLYPELALRNKIQGTVILEVEVLKDGSVRDVRVKRSAALSLDQAAIDAVKNIKFQPGRSGGKPVDTLMIIPVEFKLN
ncbi:MAG: TonB family protein [Candidatus Cloacimonetes bacterium]|nr:TonB family protein [Candidatus Cloacimonadota bacterium]